jgi:hypothetical protein
MIKKLTSLVLLASLLPSMSRAAGINILGDITRTGQAIYGSNAQHIDPKIIISNIVQIALGFLGFIFILLLLYAGFRWMTSEGNESTIEEAKATIRSSTIGLIIVLAAYSIAAFISSSLQQAV